MKYLITVIVSTLWLSGNTQNHYVPIEFYGLAAKDNGEHKFYPTLEELKKRYSNIIDTNYIHPRPQSITQFFMKYPNHTPEEHFDSLKSPALPIYYEPTQIGYYPKEISDTEFIMILFSIAMIISYLMLIKIYKK